MAEWEAHREETETPATLSLAGDTDYFSLAARVAELVARLAA